MRKARSKKADLYKMVCFRVSISSILKRMFTEQMNRTALKMMQVMVDMKTKSFKLPEFLISACFLSI